MRNAGIEEHIPRACVEQERIGRAVDPYRHVQVAVADGKRYRLGSRHVDRPALWNLERSGSDRVLRHYARRDLGDIECVIAVRCDAGESNAVSGNRSPVGEVDRRTAVVVIVGDARR